MDSRGIEPRTTPMLREYYTTKPQAQLDERRPDLWHRELKVPGGMNFALDLVKSVIAYQALPRYVRLRLSYHAPVPRSRSGNI